MKAFLVLPFILLVSSCSIYFEPEFNLTNDTYIYQVIDGDTFIVSGGEYVRLIGVDAPEKGDEKYHDATDFLRSFEGMNVMLESEGVDRDRYGRLLRHVYVDNHSLAVSLLESGHASIYDDYNGTHRQAFESAASKIDENSTQETAA